MKALTVWQPWASLIMIGAKPLEFRGWKPPQSLVGQRLAIHAASRPIKPAEVRALRMKFNSPTDQWQLGLHPIYALPILDKLFAGDFSLPLGHVLGHVRVGQPVRANQVMHQFGGPPALPTDCDEDFNWAWPMLDIYRQPPVPARGFQGLWEWRP
jgi:hypothetical protein